MKYSGQSWFNKQDMIAPPLICFSSTMYTALFFHERKRWPMQPMSGGDFTFYMVDDTRRSCEACLWREPPSNFFKPGSIFNVSTAMEKREGKRKRSRCFSCDFDSWTSCSHHLGFSLKQNPRWQAKFDLFFLASKKLLGSLINSLTVCHHCLVRKAVLSLDRSWCVR